MQREHPEVTHLSGGDLHHFVGIDAPQASLPLRASGCMGKTLLELLLFIAPPLLAPLLLVGQRRFWDLPSPSIPADADGFTLSQAAGQMSPPRRINAPTTTKAIAKAVMPRMCQAKPLRLSSRRVGMSRSRA